MSIRTQEIEYGDGDTVFAGLLAWDDTAAGPRPGVLVCHTIAGRTELEEGRALRLAELGYVGFAADVYGVEARGASESRNRELMLALRDDRPLLQQRLLQSLGALQSHPAVDAGRLAAIGFCFGGLCALDLARIGAEVLGVVSFHGIFDPPGNTGGRTIQARVLALHGWDDPLATPDAVVGLGRELSDMQADWQLHAYGNTMHAFTNSKANDPAGGKSYDENADRRSWIAMQNFLQEIFS